MSYTRNCLFWDPFCYHSSTSSHFTWTSGFRISFRNAFCIPSVRATCSVYVIVIIIISDVRSYNACAVGALVAHTALWRLSKPSLLYRHIPSLAIISLNREMWGNVCTIEQLNEWQWYLAHSWHSVGCSANATQARGWCKRSNNRSFITAQIWSTVPRWSYRSLSRPAQCLLIHATGLLH